LCGHELKHNFERIRFQGRVMQFESFMIHPLIVKLCQKFNLPVYELKKCKMAYIEFENEEPMWPGDTLFYLIFKL
jgi:hypothetical protein